MGGIALSAAVCNEFIGMEQSSAVLAVLPNLSRDCLACFLIPDSQLL